MNLKLTLFVILSFFSSELFANAKVIGNGGNVNDIPVKQFEIVSELNNARLSLMYITNFFERLQISSYPVSKNFEAFRQVIRDHEILVDTHPCYDRSGNEVDASTESRASGKICVNVDSLTKKLTASNYRRQIIGLIGHEYSHFVGATEADAVEFQKKIINIVKSTDVIQEVTLRSMELQRAIDTIETVLSLPQHNELTLYMSVRDASRSLFRVYMSEVTSESSNLLQNHDRVQIAEMWIELTNWESSLCERYLQGKVSADCQYYLDNIYQGKNKTLIQRFAEFSLISSAGKEDVVNSKIILKRGDSLSVITKRLKALATKLNRISERSYPHVGLPHRSN